MTQKDHPAPSAYAKARFGTFELDLRAAELYKNGLKVRLQEQPFQILVKLLERPGEIVLREELRTKLWPNGTVVEFDHSINAAVKRLRDSLLDSTESPAYVETVGRRGYRFIAPVSYELPVTPQPEAPAFHPPAIPLDQNPPLATPLVTKDLRVVQSRWRRNTVLLIAATALAALVIGVMFRRAQTNSPANLRVAPLTADAGLELQPSFSPDGTRVAFARSLPPDKQPAIYVKLVGPGDPIRISKDLPRVFSPAWSPDGRWISALQDRGREAAILLIPALGGPIRELARVTKTTPDKDDCAVSSFPFVCGVPSFGAALAWSHDGRYVLTSAKISPTAPLALVRVSAESGEVQALTSPPLSSSGDFGPAVSSDGRQLAFGRFTSIRTGDLYITSLSDDGLLLDAHPRPLTTDAADIRTAAWMPDNRTLLFSSDRGGRRELWRIPAAGGEPVRVGGIGEDAMDVAVSNNQTVLYNRGHYSGSLWKIPITAAKGGEPVRVTATTGRDKYAQFSPDGKQIVFQSGRSGVDEIWVCDADGANAVQLTKFGKGISGSPRWSPDSRTIAFDSNVGGSFDIYVVASDGGQPLRLTTNPSTDAIPTWSRDGAWVYFTSWRTGRAEAWKVRSRGGSETQVTRNGGELATEASDGRYLYFVLGTDLFRMPVDGGQPAKVLSSVAGRFLNVFTKGLYFATGIPKAELRYLDFGSGAIRTIAPLPGMPDVDVSSDERWILYPQPAMSDTNLLVVENFH